YEKLLNELKAIDSLEVVLAGCETGVKLADQLSEDLGLPSNGRLKTEARRDKYAMAKALTSAGLRSAKTYLVDSLAELENALNELGLPVVVKPCASAGSDDVYICRTKDEVVDAFKRVHLKTNTLGLVNKGVLLQQLLLGRQYIVNSVSYAGKHFAVEIWEDNREDAGSAYIYNYERLLLSYGQLEKDLVEYTKAVLNALGIRNGPCHVELMVNEGIPTLIEVGARPAGGIERDH
ncbi:MAG TPA: ATP-grasp domain-containing protein, partial [Herbaspirillum sp.]|nr:ATP-grasp domain-containing protein [Herbaspirillum sp.]